MSPYRGSETHAMPSNASEPSGGLAVYVTSHGFGHLNRSVAVINRMPVDVPVTIRCHPNLFDHWRRAAAAAGDARAARLATSAPSTRPATASRPTARRRSSWRSGSSRGDGRLDDEAAASSATRGRPPSSATAPRPAGRRAAGRDPRLPAGQLHLGRHLRPARPAARRRGARAGRRAPRGLSPGHGPLPGRARAADGRTSPRRSRSAWS